MRVDPDIETSEGEVEEESLSRFERIKMKLGIAFSLFVVCYFIIYALFL